VEFTVQLFRFIAVAILAVFALTVILNVGNVYAARGSFTLTPNNGTPGTNIVAAGTGYNPSVSGSIDVESGPCLPTPSGIIVLPVPASTDRSGAFTAPFSTSSLTPGPYCVVLPASFFRGLAGSGFSTGLDVIAPPIPEYPIGLPLLVIFMIIGYGVIKRRTITKQT
jgi:hypothetical protein